MQCRETILAFTKALIYEPANLAGEALTYVHGPPTLLPYYLHANSPPMGYIVEPLGAENRPKFKTYIFLEEKRVTHTFLEK